MEFQLTTENDVWRFESSQPSHVVSSLRLGPSPPRSRGTMCLSGDGTTRNHPSQARVKASIFAVSLFMKPRQWTECSNPRALRLWKAPAAGAPERIPIPPGFASSAYRSGLRTRWRSPYRSFIILDLTASHICGRVVSSRQSFPSPQHLSKRDTLAPHRTAARN
jgi:hypothetical protein